MKTFKKIIAGVLAAATLLALVGCASAQNGADIDNGAVMCVDGKGWGNI